MRRRKKKIEMNHPDTKTRNDQSGHARIKLEWEHHPEDCESIATVPAEDPLGTGCYIIHAISRPGYCDRGKYHVLVESQGILPLDDQEGFPRYYFRWENLVDEMEHWVSERHAVKDARKAGQ